MPVDPIFYLVALPTIFLVALGKGAFGGGLAMLGVPMLSLVINPIEAAIVVALLVSLMDVFALGSFGPRTWSMPDLGWLLPGVGIGITLGYFFFARSDPRIISAVIALITLAFSAEWFLRKGEVPRKDLPVMPGLAVAVGTLAGFTSFVAQAGGPPVTLYLLRRGLPKSIYAGTQLALFTLSNFVRLFPYGILALARPETLWAALVLVPAVPLGVWTGRYLHDQLDQRRLFFWCYLLLTAAAAKLLFDTLRAFAA
jgi:uncharacterized protein